MQKKFLIVIIFVDTILNLWSKLFIETKIGLNKMNISDFKKLVKAINETINAQEWPKQSNQTHQTYYTVDIS